MVVTVTVVMMMVMTMMMTFFVAVRIAEVLLGVPLLTALEFRVENAVVM